MRTHIRLDEKDNVAVALYDLKAGTELSGPELLLRSDVPRGHKFSVAAIAGRSQVVKFGQIIGTASADIGAGEHVHVHNLSMDDFDRDYAFSSDIKKTEKATAAEAETFMGYRRADGKVGTRNYIGIISSVNCSATVAKHVARAIDKDDLLAGYPNVDGIVALTHGAGCCIGADHEGFRMLQRTIWGHAEHPNFAAVLLVGLGCEVNQISMMLNAFGGETGSRLHALTMQEEGGTKKTVEAALDWIGSILPAANQAQREPCPVSELKVALQCGGSDGYSGITANPAVGLAVDRLVAQGGTAVLAETTEIYGAEHLLTRRAETPEVGRKLVDLIGWWEDYAKRNDSAINNNPTPGNKAGGLTTILEKSLGAVAKAGSTNLVGVLRYAEPIRESGLLFMDSPGYDPCSITGEVASGCNLICFTTGRGSCYGNKPVPSLKIATNTPMFERMSDDMDMNCGTAVDGDETLASLGDKIYERLLAIASGSRTKSELNDLGDSEFVPWQIGAQM
jgi:altronate hydrolase